MGLVFPRAENNKESSLTSRVCSSVSQEKGAPLNTTAHPGSRPLPESRAWRGAPCGPAECPAAVRETKRRDARRTWSEGPGSSLCFGFSKICRSAVGLENHVPTLTPAQGPGRSPRDFIALSSKKSQIKTVFRSCAKIKRPNIKNPNIKFLLASNDKKTLCLPVSKT